MKCAGQRATIKSREAFGVRGVGLAGERYGMMGDAPLIGMELARQIQLSRELSADGFVIFNLTERRATEFLLPMRQKTRSVLGCACPLALSTRCHR